MKAHNHYTTTSTTGARARQVALALIALLAVAAMAFGLMHSSRQGAEGPQPLPLSGPENYGAGTPASLDQGPPASVGDAQQPVMATAESGAACRPPHTIRPACGDEGLEAAPVQIISVPGEADPLRHPTDPLRSIPR